MITDEAEFASAWSRRFHESPGARARLVCFAHAGGAASTWFPLSSAMSAAVEVLAIQYPGRQDRFREPLIESIERLADHITEALLPRLDLPMALIGHSMGALVAFEVARRLEAVGSPVNLLVVSGRPAPTVRPTQSIAARSDDEILADLYQMGGTDPLVLQDPDLVELIKPAIRSDYKAVANYRYRTGKRLSHPILALVGDRDAKATKADADFWWEQSTEGSETFVYPGGHFFLYEHHAEVAQLVADRLLYPPGSGLASRTT